MITWRDEGIILLNRRHGETSVILDVFTKEHGRHSGVVRGGVSRKKQAILQAGNRVSLEWTARLDGHLGHYKVELLKSQSHLLSNGQALSGQAALISMLCFAFPEREVHEIFYNLTREVFENLDEENWPAIYFIWEKYLLKEIGFGLDLESCAITGSTQSLAYVSPKTGRAVTEAAAGEWKSRLFPLPSFLRLDDQFASSSELKEAAKLMSYFLEKRMVPAFGKAKLPEARARFLARISV